MKKKYLLLFGLFGLFNDSRAQNTWRPLLPSAGIAWSTNSPDINAITTDTAGNVYIAGPADANDIYYNVWEWNGSTYIKVGGNNGALNSSNGNIVTMSALASDASGNIYAPTTNYYTRAGDVAEWNGISWTHLGLDAPGDVIDICSGPNGNIYAVAFSSLSSTGNYFVATWNGNYWIQSDTVTLNGIVSTMCVDIYGNVYLGGSLSTNDTSQDNYVAMWNGTNWSAPGPLISQTGPIYSLCADNQGNVYACANSFTQVYGTVAKWNGTSWSQFADNEGDNYPFAPGSMCLDDSGYLYVGWNSAPFTDTAIITKWDGLNWNRVGSGVPYTSISYQIFPICTDHQGDIFVGGSFLDQNQLPFVAEYGPVPPTDMYVYLNATDANCNAYGTVTTTVYGGASPYTYAWSNDSATANLYSAPGGNYSVTVTDSLARQATGTIFVNSTCYNLISGIAFSDVNGNCIFDSTDRLLPGIIVQATSNNGNYYYGTTDGQGQYFVSIPDTGICKIFLSYNGACADVTLCTLQSDSLDIPSLGDTLKNINFAITGADFDLAMHPGWNSANPGFTKEYWVMPFNQSSFPVPGQVTVIFTYDFNLIYDSSSALLPLVDTTAHTLTWVLNGSSIPSPEFDWNNERFISYFQVPSTLSPNYQLQSDFVIEPYAGDCDSANNHLHFSEPVTGSHDPNAKEVSPSGSVTDNDSVLTYAIHYQNTGTDSTNFIIVKDTLSPYLLPGSVVNLASSDRYSAFNISGIGILTWIFNPLRIPDVFTDSMASKGFITFSVKKKAGLPVGTVVSNSATIYFDYNTGIQTNTVTDTTSTIVATGFSEWKPDGAISVQAFPNPFNDLTHITVSGLNKKFDFQLFDVTGKQQMQISSLTSNQFNVSRDRLAEGVYLYRIVVSGQPAAYGKLVVQ